MKPRSILVFSFFLLAMLACQLATPTPAAPPATATPVSVEGGINLDYSAVASSISAGPIMAAPRTEDDPFWVGYPQHELITLQGYPITSHLRQPQIFVYPVADMAAANPTMAQFAADLQTLLQTHQVGKQIPYLPLTNEAQLVRPRLEFINFQNGQGVMFLTQLGNGLVPVNNQELFLAFQGLTYDGKNYVAVVLPVNHPKLPADAQTGIAQISNPEDFPAYQSALVDMLEQEPADAFTPSLETLGALLRSISVK